MQNELPTCPALTLSKPIPPDDIRVLRKLSCYRLKPSYMRTAEKNCYQNSLTISRIRIDCILTNPFVLSTTCIMEYQRLAKQCGKTKAILAIARMIHTSIYRMLSDNVLKYPQKVGQFLKKQSQLEFYIEQDLIRPIFLLFDCGCNIPDRVPEKTGCCPGNLKTHTATVRCTDRINLFFQFF